MTASCGVIFLWRSSLRLRDSVRAGGVLPGGARQRAPLGSWFFSELLAYRPLSGGLGGPLFSEPPQGQKREPGPTKKSSGRPPPEVLEYS